MTLTSDEICPRDEHHDCMSWSARRKPDSICSKMALPTQVILMSPLLCWSGPPNTSTCVGLSTSWPHPHTIWGSGGAAARGTSVNFKATTWNSLCILALAGRYYTTYMKPPQLYWPEVLREQLVIRLIFDGDCHAMLQTKLDPAQSPTGNSRARWWAS
jgi:hypothetical protein